MRTIYPVPMLDFHLLTLPSLGSKEWGKELKPSQDDINHKFAEDNQTIEHGSQTFSPSHT